PLDIPWRYWDHLPRKYLGAPDCLLLLAQRKCLGSGRGNFRQCCDTDYLPCYRTGSFDRGPGKSHWSILLRDCYVSDFRTGHGSGVTTQTLITLRAARGGCVMSNHWFWLLLTAACVVWYSTITVYVAIKGAADIKHMLARLASINENETGEQRD